MYNGFLQISRLYNSDAFLKKTKGLLIFPFRITEMGKRLQKHIAFSDYTVLFSNNLTGVSFEEPLRTSEPRPPVQAPRSSRFPEAVGQQPRRQALGVEAGAWPAPGTWRNNTC